MMEVQIPRHPMWARMLRRGLTWGAVLLLSSLAAVYSVSSPFLALLLAGGVLLLSVLSLRINASSTLSLRWVPWAWLMVMLTPDHHFGAAERSALEAAAGHASLENIIQILAFAFVAGMTLRTRRLLLADEPSKIRTLPLLLFPCLALVSTLWSPTLIFTLVRAAQLLVIVGLALVMVRLWASSPRQAQEVWWATFRLFVRAVAVAILIGLSLGWPEDRFTWPGAHPGVAATYSGVGLLVLIVGGRLRIGLSAAAFSACLVLFSGALVLGQTRSVFAALVVAVLAALWDRGRQRPITRYLGIWYYALGVGLLLLAAWGPLLEYLSRGEKIESIRSLSGRTGLWEVAIDQLVSPLDVLFGLGYGAGRVALYSAVEWTSSAHNAWIEALLGVGVLGVAFLLATVVFLLWRLAWSSTPDAMTNLALCLIVFLLVVSGASEVFALPGVGFSLLALTAVPVLGSWSPEGAAARGPGEVGGRTRVRQAKRASW